MFILNLGNRLNQTDITFLWCAEAYSYVKTWCSPSYETCVSLVVYFRVISRIRQHYEQKRCTMRNSGFKYKYSSRLKYTSKSHVLFSLHAIYKMITQSCHLQPMFLNICVISFFYCTVPQCISLYVRLLPIVSCKIFLRRSKLLFKGGAEQIL